MLAQQTQHFCKTFWLKFSIFTGSFSALKFQIQKHIIVEVMPSFLFHSFSAFFSFVADAGKGKRQPFFSRHLKVV